MRFQPRTRSGYLSAFDAVGSAPGEAPGLLVFGRLDRDASREQAQAELLAIGQRTAVDLPETHEHLRPQLVPYAWLFLDPSGIQLGLALGNIFVVMLLVLVSANVALLMFARAATRETEIAVRSALGASRARIVGQLFVEGLVLAGLAVVVGLVAARVGVRSLLATLEADSGQPLPFWVGDSLTPTTVIYAGALTILSAAIISVLPALKVTSRGLEARLRQSTAGGGGFRFGGVWTAVIAAQVAATLTFPAASFFFHRWVVGGQTRDVGFSAATYLSARLQIDRESAPGVPIDATEQAFRSRLRRTYAELERRVMCRTRGRRADVCRSTAGNAASSLADRGRGRGGAHDVRARTSRVVGLGRAELLRCRRRADPGGSRVHGCRCRVRFRPR